MPEHSPPHPAQQSDPPAWHRLSQDEVLERLDADRDGLTSEEVAQRREKFGPNSIRTEQKVSPWKVLADQFASPMIYVLIAALAVTLFIRSWADAIVIGAVLVINASIGFFQEFRAKKAVQSLIKMVSPKVTVLRAGEKTQIEGDQLVPGDVIHLTQGEMAPADLRLLEVKGLQINESALTGESVPVTKTEEQLAETDEDLPPADQNNIVFMGTAIPAGLPVVMTVALAVGVRRMAKRHAVIRHLPAVETLGSCSVIVTDKTGTLTQNRMSVRELFAGGRSYRMEGKPQSRQGSIHELNADEDHGNANASEPVQVEPGSPLEMVLLCGLLNNTVDVGNGAAGEPHHDGDQNSDDQNNDDQDGGDQEQANPQGEQAAPQGDPMEIALLYAAGKGELSRREQLQRYPLRDEIPFRTEQRFSATIHSVSADDEQGPLVLIKGAPERVARMCSTMLIRADQTEQIDRELLEEQNQRMASQGLRVLSLAISRGEEAAESIRDDEPRDMTFVGMVGLQEGGYRRRQGSERYGDHRRQFRQRLCGRRRRTDGVPEYPDGNLLSSQHRSGRRPGDPDLAGPAVALAAAPRPDPVVQRRD